MRWVDDSGWIRILASVIVVKRVKTKQNRRDDIPGRKSKCFSSNALNDSDMNSPNMLVKVFN